MTILIWNPPSYCFSVPIEIQASQCDLCFSLFLSCWTPKPSRRGKCFTLDFEGCNWGVLGSPLPEVLKRCSQPATTICVVQGRKDKKKYSVLSFDMTLRGQHPKYSWNVPHSSKINGSFPCCPTSRVEKVTKVKIWVKKWMLNQQSATGEWNEMRWLIHKAK